MKRIFKQNHSPLKFKFRQSKEDFIVSELPLWDTPTDKGNYFIALVQKQDLSTLELLDILEEELQCFNIGYAGLKDKHATTTQYISVPLKFSKSLERLKHPRIKILQSFRAKEKLSIGDLKGNNFFIRLHEVNAQTASDLEDVIKEIQRHGMPNYFGYQRFGKDSGNFEKARDVAQGELVMKDKKIHRIMLHSYQSYLFNDWLAKRIEISLDIETKDCEELLVNMNISQDECDLLKNQVGLLKILPGDIAYEYKTKKWINISDIQKIRKPYKEHKIVPTGLLAGTKAWRAKLMAAEIEHHFDDLTVNAMGTRREAIVYPKSIRHEYKQKDKTFELSFNLPKGAYATVLLENLANRDLTPGQN
ncbi:tRNA pseudouridine(13) synthase TruD [Sulfurimonas sp. MAG313]|nr:tRNA pseudouridine(13) synthase TruD [Sulfurimonas sp. MAG313]MDF1881002.1 tRNA pseudouridine(13) synthase TruD [Sulfurimonas sp. MAG313]